MEHYKTMAGKEITIPRELLMFLPLHMMIGTRYDTRSDIIVKTENVIMAKDYVAALSDSRARLFHHQIVEGRK